MKQLVCGSIESGLSGAHKARFHTSPLHLRTCTIVQRFCKTSKHLRQRALCILQRALSIRQKKNHIWRAFKLRLLHSSLRRVYVTHTLQHTAMHCNTLQHTATHCNISRMLRITVWVMLHGCRGARIARMCSCCREPHIVLQRVAA